MRLNKELSQEIKYLAKRMIILNVVAYFISLIWGFNLAMLISFVVGLGFSFLNSYFLAVTIEHSVLKDAKKAKNKMLMSYIVRYIVLAILFCIFSSIDIYSLFGLTIPLFYPKIIYTIKFLRKERI